MAGKMGRAPQVTQGLGKVRDPNFILRFLDHPSKTVCAPNSGMPTDHRGLWEFLLTHRGTSGASRPSLCLSLPTAIG